MDTVNAAVDSAHPVVWVGRFESGLEPWREVIIRAETPRNRYQLAAFPGFTALQIDSDASASLMARAVKVDLEATPILCWRWNVARTIEQADMTRREGDDYAARVYISFALPRSALSFAVRAQLAIGRRIWGNAVPDGAISYVWDNRQAPETTRANVYTDRVMMVVVRSGNEQAGQWVQERRDVRQDASRLFHPEAKVLQIAVATDTDNTRTKASAGFASLHFVAAGTPCRFDAG